MGASGSLKKLVIGFIIKLYSAANNVRSKLSLGGVVGIIGEAASFLTEPLSTIYKAGIAFRQSNHGRLEISVKGDEKEAIEMKEKACVKKLRPLKISYRIYFNFLSKKMACYHIKSGF